MDEMVVATGKDSVSKAPSSGLIKRLVGMVTEESAEGSSDTVGVMVMVSVVARAVLRRVRFWVCVTQQVFCVLL